MRVARPVVRLVGGLVLLGMGAAGCERGPELREALERQWEAVGSRDPEGGLAGLIPAALRGSTPEFEELPANGRISGRPAPVDLGSHPRARRYRSALGAGAAAGPNFAGHLTVVTWGCGTLCQEFMIVDARTGEVHEGRTTHVGVEYRLDSRLLVVNPPARAAEAGCPPERCVPQYLAWNGERLEAVVQRGEREAIRRAALEYVQRETAITEITVEVEAVVDGWARIRVIPAGDATDPAVMYLRREGGRWAGVIIGTGFTPEDLDRLGVPMAVRPTP
jgi:hypothetical protein